jgi:hypothetical protein
MTAPGLDTGDKHFVSGLLYAAPLALFPLMSFFLWLDREKYGPFAWLYAAGKIISICAVLIYAVPAFGGFLAVFLMLDAEDLFINLIVPFLTLIDFIFLIPLVVSLK